MSCSHSQVVEDFDLANTHDDHKLVALQLQWQEWKTLPRVAHTRKDRRVAQYSHQEHFHAHILDLPHLPWSTDVEKQTEHITQHLHQVIKQKGPRTFTAAKKLYVSDECWSLRLDKLSTKKQIKCVHRHLRTECFAMSSLPGGRFQVVL